MSKIRYGFVTNSSSTSFIIVNKTKYKKTLVDFVEENPQLIEQYVREYGGGGRYGDDDASNYNQERLLESARLENEDLHPGNNYVIFGDEQGTYIGAIFDYILRDGGDSESFSWSFDQYHR